MIYNLSNEYEIPKFKERIEKFLSDGATIELKKIYPKRTLSQNNYLHMLLGYFGSEHGLSVEEVKLDIFKRICNANIFKRTHVNKKGLEVEYLRSTSELSTEEMSVAIERFRHWASANTGIYLPSANEQDFLIHIRKVIEENKEFI